MGNCNCRLRPSTAYRCPSYAGPLIHPTNRYFVFRGSKQFPINVHTGDRITLPLYEQLADTKVDLATEITHVDNFPRSRTIRGITSLGDIAYSVEIVLNQQDTFANSVVLAPTPV